MAKVQSNSSAATLEKMYNYTVSLISSMEILPTESTFPSYCELKNSPDKFYELYAEATHKYNVICDALQKLQHANAMLVKVLNDLMSTECKESYTVKNMYVKNFTNAKTECAALIRCYETAKASSESIVKFYTSAQYILTSRTFTDTHVNY